MSLEKVYFNARFDDVMAMVKLDMASLHGPIWSDYLANVNGILHHKALVWLDTHYDYMLIVSLILRSEL